MKSILIKSVLGLVLTLGLISCGSDSKGGSANTTTDSNSNTDTEYMTLDGVAYGAIVSSHTSRVWLDRNLGASEVCTQSIESYNSGNDISDIAAYIADQKNCFGDYYQWGRNTDGHEKINSSSTQTYVDTTDPGHGEFIEDLPDWTTADTNGAVRSSNWNPCPADFRIPTINEFENEDIADGEDAYSKLKLPLASNRSYRNSLPESEGVFGFIWSSSTFETISYNFSITRDGADVDRNFRANGFSVRCIKDGTPNHSPIANAGVDLSVVQGDSVVLDATSSSDSDGSIMSYRWMEGDVVLSTDSSFSKSDLSVGTHTIILTVTDDYGATGTDEVDITVTSSQIGAITHYGMVYNLVTSPHTNRVWLDRNLGATQVCASFDDTACYGDYYQWGRGMDGHEESNSYVTSTQSIDINNAGSSFILSSSGFFYDWEGSIDDNGTQREVNWGKVDASSACPVGFRVPTIIELTAETIDVTVQNRDDAFNNFLKLPSAGSRGNDAGIMDSQTSFGFVWSNTPDGSNSWYLYYGASIADKHNSHRTSGFSVRCVKD